MIQPAPIGPSLAALILIAVARPCLYGAVQAEKLDGFMREAQAQEAVFGCRGAADRRHGRDDEAARDIFAMKSVTSQAFHARV